MVSAVVLAAILGGLLVAAGWMSWRAELRKERWREWVAVSSAWSDVGRRVRERMGEHLDPLTAADVDELTRAIRDERHGMVSPRYIWLVNPSADAWNASFGAQADYTCLLAVVEPASGEIVFLWAGYSDVELRGESMVMERSASSPPSISPEGARQLTKGWVRIDP